MTEPTLPSDLHDLLHDRVADVHTADLAGRAWVRARARRRRREAGVLGAAVLGVAAVVVAVNVVGPGSSRSPVPEPAPLRSPSTTSTGSVTPYDGRGGRPDATYRGRPVYVAPDEAQDAALPQAEGVPVPATVRLSGDAPEVGRVRRVEAVFVTTDADRGDRRAWVVTPDHQVRSLDLSPAGKVEGFTGTVGLSGHYLAFPRVDGSGIAIYDTRTAAWSSLDTHGLSTAHLGWQGDDLLLYPSPYAGPATVCTLPDGPCDYQSNPVERPRRGEYGAAVPVGRERGSLLAKRNVLAQGWTGGQGLTDATSSGGVNFLAVGDDLLDLTGRLPRCCSVGTWLADGRLVYAAEDDTLDDDLTTGTAYRLIAWVPGTHAFTRVTTIEPDPDLPAPVGDPSGLVTSLPRWDVCTLAGSFALDPPEC